MLYQNMIEKRNIFLIGPMGSGKTTVGRYLADQLNMDFFDSDQEIEKRTGVDISWIFDVEGEEGFRKREKIIINEFTQKNGIVLATGGGSVKLKDVRNILSSRGIVIYLTTTITKQLLRTKNDQKRPLLKLNKPKDIILAQLGHERNLFYEEIADFIIDNSKLSVKIIVSKIINLLNNI